MSGPKLSEYELEQLRKAELERIQRAISNSQANIKRMQQKVFDGIKWCDQQLLQIERQLNLLSSSTLSADKTSSIKRAILSQQQKVLNLKSDRADFRPSQAAQSDDLTEVQTEENRLSNLLQRLDAQESVISDGSSEYLEALQLLADNVKGSLTCSTYSLAEAMQSVAEKMSIDTAASDEADKLRFEILSHIAALKTNKLVTRKMVDRLDHSAQLAEQESSVARLKELDSIVIKDISRKLAGIEKLYDAYQSAHCENLTLLAALGEKVGIVNESFDTPDSIKARTVQLVSENAGLRKRVLAVAERMEIEKSIDMAMDSLGYRLIGTKGKSAEGSVKLYEFSDGVGIQMTRRADGVVRMKVVGIGSAGEELDKANKEHLVRMQEDFCDVYDTIVDAFERHGVHQVRGTEKKFPPDIQFAQMIDVLEYDPNFFMNRQTVSVGKSRTSVQKPIQLTAGE